MTGMADSAGEQCTLIERKQAEETRLRHLLVAWWASRWAPLASILAGCLWPEFASGRDKQCRHPPENWTANVHGSENGQPPINANSAKNVRLVSHFYANECAAASAA